MEEWRALYDIAIKLKELRPWETLWDMDYSVPILKDELLINRLKKQRQDDSILELDIAYLNSTINDREYDKTLIPRLCMLVDARKGLILSQNMVTPGDDIVYLIFETVVNYIIQRGRPKNIVVRDAYMKSILIDLCEQTDIEVIESSKLQAIDQFVESFYLNGI